MAAVDSHSVGNSYFCLPPPGKPGPRCADGTRLRLAQKGQAGGFDCMYYALQILRGDRRIGKEPRPEEVKDRLKEQRISAYRKKNNKLDQDIKSQFACAHRLFQGDLSKKNIETSLPKLCEDYKDDENAVKSLKLSGSFCEQDTFPNFLAYLINNDQSVKERIRVCEEFFGDFNVTLEDVKAFVPKLMGRWEDLDLLEKYRMMMCYVFYVSYSFYGCELSSWQPDQPFSHFLKELKSHGPLMVSGRFGTSYYEEKPTRRKIIEGRDVYGWAAGSKRKQQYRTLHAIVIVGAEKIGERQYVYFLDPANPSKPEDVKSQKVYVMTYERFCTSIATLSGLIPPDIDANAKSWLDFLEKESQRIKSFAIYLKPLSKG